MSRRAPPLSRLRGFASDRSGIAAIEFALVLPTVALVVAVTVDFGAILFTRFKLDESVSSAANYAMVNSASVSASSGSGLASTLANLAAGSHGAGWADSSVVVNAGPAASSTGGALTTSGSSSAADSCYCPTGSAASVTWGSTRTCGASCTGGGVAGKFVQVTASRNYTPLFAGFGIVSAHTISASTLVQVQ
jgi:Flp pilus assembly protein TadG